MRKIKKNLIHYGILAAAVVILTVTACSSRTTSIEAPDYQLTAEEREAFGFTFVTDEVFKYYAYDVSFFTAVGVEDSMAFLEAAVNWKGGDIITKKESGGILTMLGRISPGNFIASRAGLIIRMKKEKKGTQIYVRGVAKKRLINRDISRKAVERLIADFEKYSGSNVTRL